MKERKISECLTGNGLKKIYSPPCSQAALFTTAKTLKQPNCLFTEEGIKKLWYVYIYVHVCVLLFIINEKIVPLVATWMDLEGITLSESDREGYIPYNLIYTYAESKTKDKRDKSHGYQTWKVWG